MKTVRFICALFFIATNLATATSFPYKAFIATPIVDMVGSPLAKVSDYKKIPISWGPSKEDQLLCPRIHQGLFNEVVTVIEIENEQALIEIANIFYDDNGTKRNSFWMPKKYLVPFAELEKRNISLLFIPQPIDANKKNASKYKIITLMMPYHDVHTKKTYSAGTRFVCTAAKQAGYYKVYIFDRNEYRFTKSLIPEDICNRVDGKGKHQKINDFVRLLQRWATTRQGIAPFCWGGCSLTEFYRHFGFVLLSKMVNGHKLHYWKLDNHEQFPCTGFDSSGLIMRAAQICDIPYYFKNTTTAANHLRGMRMYEVAEEGDLIWVPGGLFVITDLEQNLVVGAMGYQHGYGRIIELPIYDLFEGIHSIKQLENSYGKQLRMKRADGTVYRTIDEFQILKLKSLWE